MSAGSPPGHGTYPLAILSDDDGDGDGHSGAGAGAQGGRPSRAHSLRSALQSWRSIRTTLGDRPGSGGYGTSSADEADELHGAGTQVWLYWLFMFVQSSHYISEQQTRVVRENASEAICTLGC